MAALVTDHVTRLQEWTFDEEGQLVLAGLLCLDVSEVRTSDPPRLMKCHGSGGSQQWSLAVRCTCTHRGWRSRTQPFDLVGVSPQKPSRLYQVSVGQCLSVAQPLGPKGHVSMAICSDSQEQQWQLED